MVNLQRVFAAVLPNLVQQPPLVMNLPAFTDVDHEARLPALTSLCEKERVRKRQASRKTPRPEQVGERISATWLQSISDRDCLWRFRYVLSPFVSARS